MATPKRMWPPSSCYNSMITWAETDQSGPLQGLMFAITTKWKRILKDITFLLFGNKKWDFHRKPESTNSTVTREDSLTQYFLDWIHLGLFLTRWSVERRNLYGFSTLCSPPKTTGAVDNQRDCVGTSTVNTRFHTHLSLHQKSKDIKWSHFCLGTGFSKLFHHQHQK